MTSNLVIIRPCSRKVQEDSVFNLDYHRTLKNLKLFIEVNARDQHRVEPIREMCYTHNDLVITRAPGQSVQFLTSLQTGQPAGTHRVDNTPISLSSILIEKVYPNSELDKRFNVSLYNNSLEYIRDMYITAEECDDRRDEGTCLITTCHNVPKQALNGAYTIFAGNFQQWHNRSKFARCKGFYFSALDFSGNPEPLPSCSVSFILRDSKNKKVTDQKMHIPSTCLLIGNTTHHYIPLTNSPRDLEFELTLCGYNNNKLPGSAKWVDSCLIGAVYEDDLNLWCDEKNFPLVNKDDDVDSDFE